ncbi:class I adenylate-forming enzyme family protein [Paenibacillus sp. CGMCC 1.18879]|uniref:class I adenylate-forming enzyme family protein n=2 Tax=Paenibacillus TaxID=44249 RepID=UPI001CA9BB76|nr:class I adenylate-forming enzyme family protein [Paenibacillus sp. CGMCC 1.18879]MBY9080128.1 acyl--CoA ligase [Paenibacillus sp. CGMCC 1.18879]
MKDNFLLHYFKVFSDRPFIIEPQRKLILTYKDMEQLTANLADILWSKNVRKGDNVAVFFDNEIEFVISYFSILRLGAVCVPLSTTYGPNKLDSIISKLNPQLILHKSHNDLTFPFINTYEVDFTRLVPQVNQTFMDAQLTPDDPIAIMFTTGTTGEPKGTIIYCGSFIENIQDYGDDLTVNESTRFIQSMPVYHIDGWTYSTLQPFIFGASTILTRTFNAQIAAEFDSLVHDWGGNLFISVPSMLSALLHMSNRYSRKFQGELKYVICGSSKLHYDLMKQFESCFQTRILENYGSTEALLVAYYSPSIPYKKNSVGRVPEKCNVVIGTEDEILIKSPYLFREYFHDPHRTKEAFENGYYKIGDIGYLDDDRYLYLLGRNRDIINKSGIKIDPSEIDEQLLAYQGVIDAATIGVENSYDSQTIVSFIKTNVPNFNLSQLQDYIHSKLEAQKWPQQIHIVPHIPKNHIGKIMRDELVKIIHQREEVR